MSYTKLDPQPEGLEDNQVALLMDDGSIFEVKIDIEPNVGGGLDMKGFARCINADGSTDECVGGMEINTAHSASFSMDDCQRYDRDILIKNLIHLLIGEEPVTILIDLIPVNPFEVDEFVRQECSLKNRRAIRKQSMNTLSSSLGL